MYILKRVAVIVMAISLIVSGVNMDVFASSGMEEAADTQNMMEELQKSQTETNEVETDQEEDGEQSPDITEEKVLEERTIENEPLNFVVAQHDNVKSPGIQNVMVSIGNESTILSDAVLHYINKTTGEKFQIDAEKYLNDTALFTIQYMDASQTGIYELESVTYVRDGILAAIHFADFELNVEYGVNTEADAEPDAYLYDQDITEGVEENVVVFDENGNTISANSIEEAIIDASSNQLSRTTRSGQIVVVLDPGHDSTHTGASYFGLKEQDLTLKIANYCKKELETYSGVKVVMTRTTAACANHGGALASCLDNRVAIAKNANATVLVSLHLNASTSASANGVGVYCPNSNWQANIGQEGQELGSAIAKRIRELGIKEWSGASNGVVLWNSSSDTYPDGTIADYLGIVQRSKRAGFPGIIVEHAFLSNSGDVANYLDSDAKLKKLGVADAKGIADHFGLKKSGSVNAVPTVTKTKAKGGGRIEVTWKEYDDAVSYQILRSTSKKDGYKRIATVESLSYIDSGVKIGTNYYYKIRAVRDDGTRSGYSNTMGGRAIGVTTIQSVKSVSGERLQISWKKVSKSTGYQVMRCTTKNGKYELIYETKSGSTTSYIDKTVKKGVTYYYKIQTVNRVNGIKGHSGYSSVKGGWAVSKTSLVHVKSRTDKTMEIKWKPVTKAYAYAVYRSTSSNGKYTKIATVKGADNVTYVDRSVSKGKVYYYKINVLNRVSQINGTSGSCSAKSGRTLLRPTVNSVVSTDSTGLKVSWNQVSRATGYYVQRSTSKDSGFKRIAIVDGSSEAAFEDNNVAAGTTYYYRVQAITLVNKVQGQSGYGTAVEGQLQ